MTDGDSPARMRATDAPDPGAECIEIAFAAGDRVHLRQSDDPGNVITTTRTEWDAFVLGVQNDEFDRFVVGAPGFVPGPNPHVRVGGVPGHLRGRRRAVTPGSPARRGPSGPGRTVSRPGCPRRAPHPAGRPDHAGHRGRAG